ncbi:MAG: AAA family ATPase, partial [Burkholderiaceae bacterium]
MLIGREQPLDWLTERWRAAGAGERQIVLIGGEPGIGKTTLIGRFAQELAPADCALGQCVEQYGSGEPYLPVLEALNAWCRGPRGAETLELMRQVAPAWLAQFPWYVTDQDRDWLQREVQGASQARMLREMGELLERCTQRTPLLLVIEDLHWSDQATVQLIDYLARRRAAMRLMLLASFRPTEIVIDEHPLKSVRQELRLHRLCHELHLEAFSEQQIFDYLQQRFGGADFPEPFVRALHAHTEGLPLFVVNVVDELLAQRAIDNSSGRWQVQRQAESVLQVPENIIGIIEKQIAGLPGDMRALLEAASVAGMEFRPEAVAAALERDADWVGDRCETLVRHRHWLSAQPVGQLPGGSLDTRYRFRHALYRHVFYQRSGAPMRARLHRRIARSLEGCRAEQMATAAELALHCELGYDYAAALRHYVDAVGSALNRFAHAEAAQLAERALGLLPRCPDDAERQELELALVAQRGVACAQWLGIAAPEAIAAFERARALCDSLPPTPARAWVLSGLGWVYYTRAEFATARSLAQRIHDLAAEHDDPVLFVCACNLMGVVVMYQGELQAARDWLERGLAACEALGDRLPRSRFVIDPGVSMLTNLPLALLLMGFPEQARRRTAEALQRAQQIDEPMARMLALWGSGMIEAMLEQPRPVAELADRLEQVVSTHTLAQGEGPARWLRGWSRACLGDPLAGCAEIIEGYGCHLRLGMYAGASQVLHHA